MKEERKRCPHPKCGAFEGHTPWCELQPVEERIERLERCHKSEQQWHERTRKHAAWLREQVTLWKGKFLIVTQENNKLRKKVSK